MIPTRSTKHARRPRHQPGLAIPPALVWSVLLLLAAAVFLGLDRWKLRNREQPRPAELVEPGAAAAEPALRRMALPTPQQSLFGAGWTQGVQPTASGRPESGLFGSTRTGNSGLASFHEGVDIAPVARDAKGNPTDPALAVADGRVAHASRSAGDSNYGIYVVLLHPDPAGEVYTLYAHLAAIEPAIRPGVRVARGAKLGTVGHTPASIIPRDRAHLHFEIGLLANARFAAWARKEGFTNPHGMFNGRNLLGIDPLQALAAGANDPEFSLLNHLQSLPTAFTLAFPCRGRLPDYFTRHPALWSDPAPPGQALVIGCTEGGVPVWGRNAAPEEAAALGLSKAAVLAVDPAALGRNGRHLVVNRGQGWVLGRNGESWLDLLLF